MSSTTLPAATAALTLSFSPESKIRSVVEDGRVLFCAKDVAEALGYTNSNDAIGKHCKGVAKRYPLPTGGGTQSLRVIGEPDVMRLIVGSRLPAAQRFESWVFEEVLPCIARFGTYPAPQVRQHAPKARPADRVLDRDLLNLRLAVRWIGDGHVPAIRRACWAAIRSATGVRQLNELRVSDLPLAVDALRGCALVVATIDAYTATVEKFAVEQMIDGHAGRELAAAVEDELHLLPGRFARSGVTARLPKPVREALDRTSARLPVRDVDLHLLASDDENHLGRVDDLPPELTHLEP